MKNKSETITKAALQRQAKVRSKNLGRLLIDAHRFFSACTLKYLHAYGFPDLKPTHMTLLRCIDFDGTRISDIATRLNVTKQAITQLVRECEVLKYITCTTAPDDGRSKIVRFTKKGLRFFASGQKVVGRAMKDVEAVVGQSQLRALRETLSIMAEQSRDLGTATRRRG